MRRSPRCITRLQLGDTERHRGQCPVQFEPACFLKTDFRLAAVALQRPEYSSFENEGGGLWPLFQSAADDLQRIIIIAMVRGKLDQGDVSFLGVWVRLDRLRVSAVSFLRFAQPVISFRQHPPFPSAVFVQRG